MRGMPDLCEEVCLKVRTLEIQCFLYDSPLSLQTNAFFCHEKLLSLKSLLSNLSTSSSSFSPRCAPPFYDSSACQALSDASAFWSACTLVASMDPSVAHPHSWHLGPLGLFSAHALGSSGIWRRGLLGKSPLSRGSQHFLELPLASISQNL